MSKQKVWILLTLIFSFIEGKEWIPITSATPDHWDISLVESTELRTVLHLTVPGFYIEEVWIQGERYIHIFHEDAPAFLQKGLPGLPRINASIVIPDQKAVAVSILDVNYTEIQLGKVAPSKGNILRTQDPSKIPYEFDDFYHTNSWFPRENVHLSDPFIFRDVRGVSVQFQPIQYNPATATLKVATSLTLAIDVTEGVSPNIKSRIYPPNINRNFMKMYQHLFLNFKTYQSILYEGIEEPGYLVIITYDDFLDPIIPFAQWKRQKGLPTTVVPLSEIGASTSAIKAYLQDRYNAGELTYVILVGDDVQMPVLYGSTRAASDPSYVMLEGDDFYPDAFISRISAQTVEEVENQVNKFIAYEKEPAEGDWFHLGVGVASAEGSDEPPDYLEDWERAEILRNMLLNYTYTNVDQIYAPDASLSELIHVLNNGRSIFNYIGHGSGTSWGTTGFSNTHASTLTNGYKLPFIIDVSCLNGKWHGMTSLAEAFLRNPEGGAVGMFASSVNSAWVPPTVMQKHTIELLVNDLRNTMGGLAMHGSIYTLEAYNGGVEGISIVEEYNLFGDCTLPIRTDTPVPLMVTHDPVIPLGTTSFSVSTGVAGAMVGLIMNDELYATGISDEWGNVNLQFLKDVLTPGTITLTVTAYNHLPYITTIQVIQPEGPFITFDSYIINDVLGNYDGTIDFGETVGLRINLSNVGTDDAFDVVATVSTSDPYILILTPDLSFGDVGINETITSENEMEFEVSNQVEDGHSVQFDMEIVGSDSAENNITWHTTYIITIEAPVINVTSYSLLGEGENGKIDPGETVQMVLSLMNTGAEVGTDVSAIIATQSPYITIQDDQAYFGTISGNGGTVINSSNPYIIFSSLETPIGTDVSFILNISAQNEYTATDSLHLTIGQNQFYSENVPKDFGPKNIESFIQVPISLILTDVDVMVDITHPWVGDIQLKLQSPAGSTINLVSNVGGSGDNFTGTIFDDDASIPIDDGSAPFSGSFQPEQPLSTFDEENSFGKWRLIVIDKDPSTDDGTLNAWNLTLSGESAEILCLSGDVNGDGGIDVFDVVRTVNIILGTLEPNETEFCAADYDKDGEVLIFDVVKIVNAILGIEIPRESSPTKATIVKQGNLLKIKADGPIGGLQIVIESENDPVIQDITDMEIASHRSEKNSQIILYSLKNRGILEETIATVIGDYSLKNVEISDPQGEKVSTNIQIIPQKFALHQNYPNPFNPVTNIPFDLRDNGIVEMAIYNVVGQKVKTLVNTELKAGYHKVMWDGKDDQGRSVGSGIYIYSLSKEKFYKTRKMVLLK